MKKADVMENAVEFAEFAVLSAAPWRQAYEAWREGLWALATEIAHAAILGLPEGTPIFALRGKANPVGLAAILAALKAE